MRENRMTPENCFLTGTDTEIGKTHAACLLLHHWRCHGLSAAGYKPVASGGTQQAGGWLLNEDAERLLNASSPGQTPAEINPVCLQAAIAPHVAARDENRHIELGTLVDGYRHLSSRLDRVVVEGVGGFRVPLGADFDSADLAVALGLPVVLVVGLRLGCINHALLSAEAILARGLRLAGWIGNTLSPAMPRQADTVETLRHSLPAPCWGVLPWSQNLDHALDALRIPDAGLQRQTQSGSPGII